MKSLRIAAFATAFIAVISATASAGTITKVSAAPAAVVTGQTVTFTEEGTNSCGASNMNYGDGIVITYPITELPAKQTHVYEKPGTYTVIARGMGNCDGEATTTVQVRPAAAPPPPAPAGPHITAVDFVPAQGVIRRPVTFVVNGVGQCRFTANFGDGNSRELTAELPYRFDHTYAVAGTYTTIVTPSAPCSGRFTQLLTVTPRARARAISNLFDLNIDPSPANTGRPVTITIDGEGSCGYAIDFGDGNNDSRTVELPDRIQHTYPASGEYVVTATAIPPCTGSARRTLRVWER